MKRYRYRLPPCAAYDLPAMEGWLEDMAARGLHLEKDGFFGLLATFEEGPPRQERFRLEATDRKGGLFSEEYDPEDEQMQMLRQMGWHYRARRGQFHIYSSDDPSAPELNTDPRVQAVTMAALTKFLWKKLRDSVVLTLFYLILYFGDLLISSTLLLGTPLMALTAGLLLWDLGRSLWALMTLIRFRRQLQRGDPLPHRRDYRRSGRRYLTAGAIRLTLWVVVILGLLGRLMPILTEEHYEPLKDQPLPIYTLADYYPDGEIQRIDGLLKSRVYSWSDILTPENTDLHEYAQVTLDGETFDCWLTVRYHRTRWAWTARALAAEFVSQAGANLFEQTAARVFGNDPVIAREIDLPDADYCVYFYKNRSSPHILIQKGTVVLQVNLEILDTHPEPQPEELARLMLLQIS